MKARDQFKSLFGAVPAAVMMLLGAAGVARAATPSITGAGAVADILDTASSRLFEDVRLADGDGDDVVLRVSFPATHGTLPTSASFSRVGDIYTLLRGTPSNATYFITNLVFTPQANSISIGATRITRFTLTLTDTNNLSATNSSTTLEVTPVNDVPTISGAGVIFNIGDNETNRTFASVQIADVDNLGTQPVTLTVVIDKPAQGNFTNGTLASFTLSSSNRYMFSGTPAAATAAIQGLLFKPLANRLPVGASEITRFTVTVADDGVPSLKATNANTQVTATSINDVPEIGGILSAAQPVRTGSTLDPFSGVIIADPDVNADTNRNGQALTVTVTLTGASVIGELNPPGGLATTVTLMNVTATEASAAIQALLYSAPGFPVAFGTTNRMTARVVVTDSAGGSRTNTLTTIDVYSPFTPPGLSGTQADQRVNDKSTLAPFSAVSIQSLNGGAFAVLVQLDDDARGELINLSGFVKTAGPRARYSFTGGSEAATVAIRQLLFRPTENRLNGAATETVRFEISLIDGGTINGPDANTTVIVSPVNDRPVIQGIPLLIRITDNETTRAFRTVGISDADERGTQSVHIVITLDDTNKGSFASASLGGFTASAAGYAFDGPGFGATLAISNLLFVPAENRVPIGEAETTVFTITVDDGHGGLAVNNGTAVRVASVAGAPKIVVPMPQPISRPLTPPLYPFESVLITDEEDLTVTVALVQTNQGTFTSNSLAATGFTNSGPGAFTFHGTVLAVSNAITKLDFAPNTNLPPGVIAFSITAVDTTGNSVTETHSILLRAIQRVYVVTKTGDYDVGETDSNLILGTLRKAVEDAGSNDHITFDLRPPTNGVPDLPATIRLRRMIALTKSVTIDGPGANLLTISGDMDANSTPDVQLFQVGAHARLNRLTLTKGNAGFAGGAVGVRPGGSLTISYCAVTDSQAEQWGGGIDVDAGALQMDHCLISSNRTIAAVGQGGGGVAVYSDQHCVIENTTFSGNSQQSPGGLGGGALYAENLDPGTPLIIFVNGCTFRDNTDEAGGGTSIRPNVFDTQVLLKNTILADGRGENLDVDESGLIISYGGNLSDDSTRTVFSFGGEPYEVFIFEPPADKTNVVPRLGPLAVNAGPTRTHALEYNSPALAAAVTNTLGTDQRGYWRDAAPDSGAFERGARRQIIINEIAFDPAAPGTNDEFIEFYVPRSATNVNLAGFQVYIGGVLRHTFGAQALAPGQGLVLFSKDATSTNVPAGVSNQVAAGNLLLDNNGDTITVKNPAGQIVFETSYVGSFTSSDTTATNLFGPHQSLTLVPEFTGVLLPFQRAYQKVVGVDPNPMVVSSPGTEISGRSLAGGNAPPVAFDDRLTTDEDTVLAIAVLDNDVELDGNDYLHIVSVSSPSTLDAPVTATTTNIIYDPASSMVLRSLPEGGSRVDSVTYTLIDCCDPGTGTNWPTAAGGRYTATNFITVMGVNDAPTPMGDSVTNSPQLRTFEDRVLEINVVTDLLPNDTDPDTDDDNTTLEIAGIHAGSAHEDTFEIFSQLGAMVTLELRFNRNETRIIYDPSVSATLNALAEGEVTNDVFYYSLIDRHGAIGVAEVRIQVTGTNDLPIAVADVLATDEDTVLTVAISAILGNDTDPDTDDNRATLTTLRISAIDGATSLVSTTAFGARIEVSGTNIIYTPTNSARLKALARKEVVVDSFSYTASDNFGGSNTTTVLVTVTGVNDRPVARPDLLTVNEDVPVTVPAPGVLGNDFDFDVNLTPPDDVLRVIPAAGFSVQGAPFTASAHGGFSYDPQGRFDYLAVGQTTNDSFSYTMVDDSYTIANDDEFSVVADTANVVLVVLANDVTLTGTGGRVRVVALGATSDGGTVAFGAFSNSVVYTPQINFVGVETFQYAIEDGQGGRDTATVRVKATVPVLNGHLVANADRFTVARGTSANLEVLANDNVLPAGGEVLTLVAIGPTDKGGTVATNGSGLNSSIRFTPDSTTALSFPYIETFNYTVAGGGGARATGTVVVTVVNRMGILPVNDDVFTVIAGTSSSSLDVLGNDRVVPGTTTNLVITGIETNGVSGSVSINANRNRLLYVPPVGAVSHVEPVFRYFISDESGGSATGEVMVTVMEMGLNANDDFCFVARNSTNTLLVLANDNALPNVGQNLLVTTIGLSNNAPNHGGKASVSPNGKSIIYAPSPTNLTGEETFTYEISDGTLTRAQGRVKLKILDRQGAVNVNADSFSVVRDSTNNLLRVLRNDNGLPDTRERLTITGVGVPARGGLARLVGSAPNQSVLYSPARDFVGDEDFTYSVADNRGGTAITTVRVHVGHLIANDDLFSALSGSQDNVLDVLANDTLLNNGTPLRPLLSVGLPDSGGTVRTNAGRDALLYTPLAGFVGLESFNYQVADDSGGLVTARATVRVLPAGGDRDTTNVNITITGVNDAPTINGTTNSPVRDKDTVRPFLGVTIGDVDHYGQELVTVTIIQDAVIKGGLVNLGGFAQVPPGTYTLRGTPAVVTAAIRSLLFVPTENRITVPTTETTHFIILANDGVVTVTNTGAAVDVTAVNDAPTIAGTMAGQTVYHRLTLRPFASVTISEVDDIRLQSLRITVAFNPTNGYLTSLGGFTLTGAGTYTLTNANAAVATATLRGLIFVPTTDSRVAPGGSETTRLALSVEDGFAPAVTDTNTTVLARSGFIKKLQVSDGSSLDEFGYAVATTRDLMVVGVPMDETNPNSIKTGAAYLFARNADGPDQWGQIARIMAPDAASGDRFGFSVSISGDTILVGAPEDSQNGTDSGSAYLFERNQGGSNQWGFAKKILPADPDGGDDFGQSVGIDGDTLIVGAVEESHNGIESGAAYVFQRSAGSMTNWSQVKKLIPDDGESDDEFGFAVAISADAAVVGSRRDDDRGSSSGSVYVFERHQGGTNQWGLVRKLFANDAANDDEFGRAVAISGELILVGAPFDTDGGKESGSAYVFVRNSGGTNLWVQTRKLLPPDPANDDEFGYSVAIDRELMVIGARKDDDNGTKSGSAYVFVRNHPGLAQWSLVEKLLPPGGDKYDQFGFAVAIAQNTVAVGARHADINGRQFGSTYVFRLKFNNGPFVISPIPDQMAAVNAPYAFTVPANTFGDYDPGEFLTLAANVGGPGQSPDWLGFNPAMGLLSGAPNATGLHAIVITATDADGVSAASAFNLVVAANAPAPLSFMDIWRRRYFDAADLIDPRQEATLWGDHADPDRDGLSNREEHFFGLNPLVAEDPADRSVLKIAPEDATGRLLITFNQRTVYPSGTYVLETSSDLLHWNLASGVVEAQVTVVLNAEMERVTVRVTLPAATEEKRFFRLKIQF